MTSLYRRGWRQGSLLRAQLTCNILDAAGEMVPQAFEEWVLVTQECDLDWLDETALDPLVELRPVYENTGGYSVGVRSEVFVFDQSRLLHAQSPRLMVTPRALAALIREAFDLPPRRARLLKTWLGLRYDRPAVPDEFLTLSKAVAEAVKARRGDIADAVLDVLLRLESGEPPAAGLYAITENDVNHDRVEKWLQSVAQAIPPQTGYVKETVPATVHQVSLWMIQNTYSADLTQLSITRADKREI